MAKGVRGIDPEEARLLKLLAVNPSSVNEEFPSSVAGLSLERTKMSLSCRDKKGRGKERRETAERERERGGEISEMEER